MLGKMYGAFNDAPVSPMLSPATKQTSEILHLPKNVLIHADSLEARKYTVFNENQESWISFRILAALYIIYSMVSRAARWNYFALEWKNISEKDMVLLMAYEVVEISLLLIFLVILYLRRGDRGETIAVRDAVNPDNYSGTSWRVILQNVFIVGTTIHFAFWLLTRLAEGQCHKTLSTNNFRCNPFQDEHGLPMETLIALMLIPMTFCVAFRGTPFSVQITSWIITVATIGSTAAFVSILQNIPYLLIFAPTSLFLIYENERQNKVIFLITERLSQMLEENERLADETHANELRHILGNVAHDLRTPLSAFLNCTDTMTATLKGLQLDMSSPKMAPNSSAESSITELGEQLSSLRDASTFMSMAINRCLDFTKATKGIALTANLETIDINDVFKLPLRVVNDMQNRIGVVQLPIPDEICSHISMDMQWLQENLLCLLTNAVKYATSGVVTIGVTLESAADLPFDSCELSEDVFASARLRAAAKLPISPKTLKYTEDNSTETDKKQEHRSQKSDHASSVNGRSQKSVEVAFTEVTIRRIHQGVIFISKKITKSNSFLPESVGATFTIKELLGSRSISEKGFTLEAKSQDPRSFLRFEVIDEGIGLDESTMLTIFHPFRQNHRMNGGVGLGLFSLAKRTEALGGFYGVSARPDGHPGCRFFFGVPYTPDNLAARLRVKPAPSMLNFLRRDKVVLVAEENSSRRTSIDLNSAKMMKELRILVVDDSLSILKMTTMVLRKQGHTVETAMHGADAIDKLELARLRGTRLFDLVLIDLQMPVMDGLEAMKRIRAAEQQRFEAAISAPLSIVDIEEGGGAVQQLCGQIRCEHQIIVAMSANSDLISSGEAIAAGADRFIAKPFTIDSLNQILCELNF